MSIDPKRLRELAEAATKGPWKAGCGKGSASVSARDAQCAIYINVNREGIDGYIQETVDRWHADARYIAAANPTTVLALLDELAAMTAARDEACDIADRELNAYDNMGDYDAARIAELRIAELRKVGQ